MKTNNEFINLENSVVALGSFDGVHKGHQAILSAAVNTGRELGYPSVALCLLPPHPRELIENDIQRHVHIEEIGIDICIQQEFLQYHTMSAEEFIDNILVKRFGCKAVVCGEDFRFGYKRRGDVGMLHDAGNENNFNVIIPNRCDAKGVKISSTGIRTALKNGDIEEANAMLGRPYSIDYVVKHGFGIGEKLGFPTINQYWQQGFVRPKKGVYITSVIIDGKEYPSATGVTTRPTFTDGESISCETTIVAEVGDLYGENVELFFHSYLFEPKKFTDTSELTAMVLDACDRAKKYHNK